MGPAGVFLPYKGAVYGVGTILPDGPRTAGDGGPYIRLFANAKSTDAGAAGTFGVIRQRFVAGLWPVRSGRDPTRPATVHRTVALNYSNLRRMQKTSGTNVPEVFW